MFDMFVAEKNELVGDMTFSTKNGVNFTTDKIWFGDGKHWTNNFSVFLHIVRPSRECVDYFCKAFESKSSVKLKTPLANKKIVLDGYVMGCRAANRGKMNVELKLNGPVRYAR